MKTNILSFRLLLLIFSISFLYSCSEKEDCIYNDKRLCDPNYDGSVYRGTVPFSENLDNYDEKFILEEFTGFRCTNCPTATATAKNLATQYSGRLVVVGVHCTSFFAAPLTDDPSEPFFKDFRTDVGEIYYEFFNPPGLPDGVINRLGTENTSTISYPLWGSELQELMPANNPDVFIEISDISINADSSEIAVMVTVKPINLTSDRFNINMGIMENGIEEAQKEAGNETIYDYVHDHVLRGNSNGPWGSFAYDGDIELEANEALSYELKISTKAEWNLDNCDAFVYITKESNREVLQVEVEELY